MVNKSVQTNLGDKMESKTHWYNMTTYEHSVTGKEIVEKQLQISLGESMFVVATQIFPLKANNEEGLPLYDCFIYYKTQHIAESLMKEGETLCEDRRKKVVIPK